LLNQLCANLNEYGLATNELRLRLVSEPGAVTTASSSPFSCQNSLDPVATAPGSEIERTITLPVPMCNPKTLLRLLLFDIEAHPPAAPVVAVAVKAEPMKPRATQTGLFIPLAPEPEKLEITLARLAKLVGPGNVGSPELLDTHRPDAFLVKRFTLTHRRHKERSRQKGFGNPAKNRKPGIENPHCVIGFRTFRPPCKAAVHIIKGQPARIDMRAKNSRRLSGQIVRAAGPWRGSGDWWRADVWARDEWDVAVIDVIQQSEVLCRIYRDLISDEWFVAGIYD
jgi:protein ImuB